MAYVDSSAGEAAGTLPARRLSPSLTVNDLQQSIQFYTEGLGFEIQDRSEVEGAVRFVMLRAGEAWLGLGQDDFAKGRDRVKGVGVRMWITTTRDVQTVAERARRAGISLDSEPEPLPWGPLAFAVTDPDGYKLTIVEEG